MTAVVRFALLSAIVAASTAAVARGQESSSDSLNRRIVLLERKVADLDQRVRELETLIKVEPSRDRPVPASAKWRDLANWRRLRRGMNMDQVRALLGEPERVDAISILTAWTWGTPPDYAEVRFDEDKVAGWSEPRR